MSERPKCGCGNTKDENQVVEIDDDKRLCKCKCFIVKTQCNSLGSVKRKELYKHGEQEDNKEKKYKDMRCKNGFAF